MSTLTIRKKSLKTWLHTDSILGDFIISKFYFNADNGNFQVVEQGQSKRVIYDVSDITLYDDSTGGSAETFANITALSLRLEELNYPAFQYDGQIVSIANLISEGTNITITGDGTEASPYVISATGGGFGTPNLEQVLTEGNESTTQDAIFRLDADKYLKINRATQKIELFDETIDAVNPITYWDKDSFFIKDATGNQMSISAGYTNNLLSDGSTAEIFGSNIILTNGATYLNLTNEQAELNDGVDAVAYRVDRIIVNGVDYTLPTGATSQIATLLDIPAPITIDTTIIDGSTNPPNGNAVFDALALKANVNRSETFIFSKANGTFGTHTGTTAETVILTSSITGGVFEIGDWLNLMYDFTVVGTAGSKTVRFRAGTTGTTADALIGTAFFTATVLDAGWSRERMQFKTGNILSGVASNYTSQVFDTVVNTVVKQSTSLNPANTWILSVSVQLGNSADTVSCEGYVISRVKSF